MKITKLLLLAILTLGIASCIKKEALNAEADILSCSLPEELLANDFIDISRPFDQELQAHPVYIFVKQETDRTKLSPLFELTPGATISPENGSMHDFTKPVQYTVTSEDGNWHRTYQIFAIQHNPINIPTFFHFETVKNNGRYFEFYETNDEKSITWASGNGGFKFAVPSAGPSDYPTTQDLKGKFGKCVKLSTKSTGSLGEMVNMPIAAGNLFLGQFNIGNAITQPLQATQFGVAFYEKPISMSGYYKYKASDHFYNGNGYIQKKDVFDIYAIFYETDEQTKFMDGKLAAEYNFVHPNMVAMARVDVTPETAETDEWKHFNIQFDYKSYGKQIDPAKLKAGKYNLSIVMASSRDGALFKGAPGSTLWVDEVKIECK